MRIQLALNVQDIDRAVEFYSTLFATPPAKRKPGYANFAIENPALKLVLFESKEGGERLNHLGVEVSEAEELESATKRLKEAGLADLVEDESTCCFATQDKVWAVEPEGLRWEWYRVLADSETFSGAESESESEADKKAILGNASEAPEAPAAPPVPQTSGIPERCC